MLCYGFAVLKKEWPNIASSYVMGWQCWETMTKICVKLCYGFAVLTIIKYCVKLCYGFAMFKNNDQKLSPVMLLICSDEKQWSKIASSYLMSLQWWKTMIKNCVKLFDWFAMVKNNDQKLRQTIWWVCSGEKQWSKIASRYVNGSQCWEIIIKICVELCYLFATLYSGGIAPSCYEFAMFRNNDQKFRQAMLWISNDEKQWSKIGSSYTIDSQWWKTLIQNCVKLFCGFATLYSGRGRILNTLLKFP